jgi:NAD(P)-dependent dehydrogenase (short-subunit alcohol dehydrogenase family)
MDKVLDVSSMTWATHHRNVMFVPVDLLDRSALASCVDSILARQGRIDVVCHTAGGFTFGESTHATAETTWEKMHAINVRTLLNVSEAIVPHMIESQQGKIVTVGAQSAQRGQQKMAAYVASKSVVLRITESMSSELREHNINVNCVLPSIIDSPANRLAMPDEDPQRWVRPGDLAEVMVFLCSGAARAIHGAALPVTGLV